MKKTFLILSIALGTISCSKQECVCTTSYSGPGSAGLTSQVTEGAASLNSGSSANCSDSNSSTTNNNGLVTTTTCEEK